MAKLKSAAKTKRAKSTKQSQAASNKAEALSRSIMDSAQQIWSAGMGAFARAQGEGTKLFESLVKEGSQLEKATRKLAGGKVDVVRDVVESRVGQVKERAADTWDRLEKVFEERVQRSLNRLGVPSKEDLQGLSKRVDQLNAELRKLSNGSKPAVKKAAKPAATKKAVRKTAAAAPVSDATE
ncbi:phasin family protein [Pseudomarimonas arenosa]|uniref:Phasin family protein n=1 Tax=Pseudomarimonas arenosa TaxID=2774145 RepID=A0AAW3ZJU8_9GAMM|nr:phasin family protein [Pseudomarimonas arenosa]MBD8524571.1 phasin family protein [Pseudomarimonas arenosa]